MMDDMELLELAAMAVGIVNIDFLAWDDGSGFANLYHNGAHEIWNPLTDDGDALRLAVKLNIHPAFFENVVLAGVGSTLVPSVEPIGDDKYAATRRAIVRAAAEIGKGMK